MITNTKSENAYRTIGEITKELGLIDKKTGNLQTHTLRYWESQFRQIRPVIRAGNRRYYSNKDLKIVKQIKSSNAEKTKALAFCIYLIRVLSFAQPKIFTFGFAIFL